MKKLLTMLLAATLLLTILAGCVNTAPDTSEASQTSPRVTTPNDNIDHPPPRPTQLSISRDVFELFDENGYLTYQTGGPLPDYLLVYSLLNADGLSLIFYILGFKYITGYRMLTQDIYDSITDELWWDIWDAGYALYLERRDEFLIITAGLHEFHQVPPFYRAIHMWGITYEELLAFVTILEPPHYSPEFVAAMFLPREEMLEFVLQPNGAVLNGVVHNIWSLNYVFENDIDTFVEICLDELIDFQVRLEGMHIYTGFNAEMVEFANANNVRRR